ncbi:NfeD family protein [Corynebacterium poyangense]|uniref:NfeD family protein n=1 Tax=Corynebacterium poyangense TaxID=2684405 RepID=A0A7H0SNW9_9CORY|nr:NfeD family protein [Corynebacterium poyangense]MBZ8177804.1 NfeD family protein [Corynebacterium poyangense]QNQ90244.1 NfeD family protein [Corynebacterium poyangense]
MAALLWLIASFVLAGLELLAGEFTLLMLAGGALAAAGASFLGASIWFALLIFALVSLGLIVFLRPLLRKRAQSPLILDTSVQALVGQHAEVLEEVGLGGQVRLDGSIWSARSLNPSHTFSAGEVVNVVSIDGSTAIVWKES